MNLDTKWLMYVTMYVSCVHMYIQKVLSSELFNTELSKPTTG